MSDNTASNLGTGQGIFAQKVGDDLQFKGLVAGTNVTLTADANNITITASNDTTALNLGTGSGLFTSKSGDNLQFKSIIANADSGISLTSNTNDLTLQLVSANVDAGKLGGVAASDYLRKSDNLLSVASAATARTNLSVYSKAEIDANVIKNNQNNLPDTDSTYLLGNNSYKFLAVHADNFYGRASIAGALDSIADIGDVDTSGAVNGSVLKYNSSNGNWEVGTDLNTGGGGGGSATFVGLTDTPSNFTGDAGKFVRVNSGESALEFTTDVATQTYVNTQVANLVDSAPGTLDTLNELAAALGDDANFSTTITNSIATKLATADFTSTANTWLGTKDTGDLSEGSNLYFTTARVDAHLNQSNPTAGYVLSWNGSDYAWVAPGASGDITSVVAGTGLTGGATSGDATLNVDVGTTANKIVQLDGSGRLPAVDGSQLTGVSTTTTLAGLTDTTIGTAANGEVLFYNGSAWVDQALTTDNVSEGANLYYTNARADARADGRIGAASLTDLSDVNTGATAGQVLKWNGSAWAPAADSTYTNFNSDFDTRLATKDTGDVAEGSNLYFTNARADARVQAASLTDLSNVDAVVAGDDGKILYYDHSTTSFKWKTDASGGPADTDALAEGSTNLYYTDARFDARLQTRNISNLADVYTTGASNGQALVWSSANSRWQPGTVSYTNFNTDFDTRLATKDTGDVAEGTNLYFTTARIDAHLNQSNPTAGYVLSWNGSDYAWVDNGTTGATAFTGLTDTPANYTSSANRFVKVNSAGNGLEFVADPGYLTSVPAQSFASLTGKPTTIAGYGITDAFDGDYNNLSNKPTIPSAYANSDVDAHLNQSNPTAGYVLSWNGSDYAWIDNAGYTDTDFDNRLATKSTSNLSEGSNLYFTNTRADARIAAANISALANVHTAAPTDGQVLKWDNANSRWAPANDSDTVYTTFNTDFDTRLATKTTANLTEGSNLYFTNARADARFDTKLAAADTGDLSEGTNLYYTDARARAAISEGSTQLSYNSGTGVLTFTQGDTDTVAEGSTNLYFSDSRVDARINAQWLLDEDNMASNSATQFPTQQSVKAYVDAQIAAENELSEANDVSITSVANNQFLKYNSSTSRWENATVTPASAAGSDTYVQFNDGGVMGGDAGFVYNKTTDALTVGSVTTTGSSPQVSAAGNLGISTTASNGNITFTPHGTGDVILSANVKIDGSDNDYLKWTAPYSTEGDLPSASTYHGMFAHVHGTGKGYFAHGGNWIKLLDETSSTTTNLTEGTNLYYTDARFDTRLSSKDTGDLTEGSNLYFTNARADARADGRIGAASLTDLSDVNTGATSGQVLKWNGSAWAPAADSTYTSFNTDFDTRLATKDTDDVAEGSTNLYYTDARADTRATLRIGAANLSALNDVNGATPTDGQVLTWDNANSYWKPATASGAGTLNTAGNTGTGSVTLASETLQVLGTTGQINVDAAGFALSLSLASDINSITSISFEGSTADTNETKLQAVDPTADRTINLPDASGHLPVFATASPAAITDGTNGQALVTDGNGQLSFTTITSGSSLTVQDEGSALATAATTLNFVGAGVTASGTGATKTITISGGGGGSSGTEYEEFKINYATNGNITSISDTSSGISGVNIDSATGGDLTVTFTGYTTPPLSFAMYGYNYTANEYNYNTVASGSMTVRKVPGGGSSGSPTAFGSFSTMTIRCSESETGASRSFGTTTHAWVRFVMGA